MSDLAGTHGGMSDQDQPQIPLNKITVTIFTSAGIPNDPWQLELLKDRVWRLFPSTADDGDVFITLEKNL